MPKDVQPKTPHYSAFEVFRYQLVVDKALPINMFEGYTSAEEVRADKNNIFHKILTRDDFKFRGDGSELSSKLLYTDGTMTYYRLGVKRKAKVYKKDFSEQELENYPNIILSFNNDPKVQKIAIQTNAAAFKETKQVSHIIQETFERELKPYNLSFFNEPIYDKQEFWNLVKKYPKQITQLTFDLISPNMANISSNLKLDLHALHQDTNTVKTKLELNAEEESYLDIKEESKFVNSLVNYSADGGGDIYMRVAGKRKKIHTAQSPDEFNIEKQLLEGNIDWEKLNEQFKDILI